MCLKGYVWSNYSVPSVLLRHFGNLEDDWLRLMRASRQLAAHALAVGFSRLHLATYPPQLPQLRVT